jgi:hypothetical protein
LSRALEIGVAGSSSEYPGAIQMFAICDLFRGETRENTLNVSGIAQISNRCSKWIELSGRAGTLSRDNDFSTKIEIADISCDFALKEADIRGTHRHDFYPFSAHGLETRMDEVNRFDGDFGRRGISR